MNDSIRTHLAAAALIAAASLAPLASASFAQSPNTMKFTVPFAFDYGSHHFAAGTYTIGTLSEHVTIIRGEHAAGTNSALPDVDRRVSADNKAVFLKYGDQYFLREVWTAGQSTHVHYLESKAEKKARTAIVVAGNAAPESISMAMVEEPAR